MQVINRADVKAIKILVNEFLATTEVQSKENIPFEFIKYLHRVDKKIEDGVLSQDK